MTDANPTPPSGRGFALRLVAVLALAGTALGFGAMACGWRGNPGPTPDAPADDKQGKEPTVGSIPLFSGWPKGQKPDAAIVLSGQSFGYLQPCGCSRPQFGGLERRAVFINSLRAKGWPVVGFDLGDMYESKSLVASQAKLKYKVMMQGLRDMGYIAVGVGKSDIEAGLDNLLAEYTLQKEQPPFVLAGNLMGVSNGKPEPREKRFPTPPGAARPMIGVAEVADVAGTPVGVVGIIGASLAPQLEKIDPSITFPKNAAGQINNQPVLQSALAALQAHPLKPQLNVLLYQGTSDEAKALAKAFPQFQVILCQADDPEPPQFPAHANDGKTLIVQVGHKGRYVGVVGAFKKPGGGFDLKYQLVPLGEEYITPGSEEEARKANPILPLFENYAEQVRDQKLLAKVPKGPHPAQVQEPKLNLSYIGSERCQNCHAAEFTKWSDTKHSHAMEALEKVAKRPGLRWLDGECVQCHVVGLLYKTGYENQKATPQLSHVGCESCHGPGSGHAADPKAANLLALQAPWKTKPDERLPDIKKMKEIGALSAIDRGKIPLKPEEQRIINAVSTMCAKCHDHENDPHFDIFTYWPKVYHSFRNPPGGGGGNPEPDK